MSKKEERPKCRSCGRELRIARRSTGSVHWYWKSEHGPRSHAEAEAKLPPGARVTRVKRYEDAEDGRFTAGAILYHKPGVEFGDYGDGFFCGLRCGYALAVAILKRTEKKETQQ